MVEDQDQKQLLTFIDPAIRTSFGGEGGLDHFRESWEIESPDSRLWNEMGQILRMGGSFRGEGEGTSFWAPYVYANWPDTFDPFQHVAATHRDVVIRQRPSPDSAEIASAGWAILEVVPGEPYDPAAEWRRVRTIDRKNEGWVRAEDVRSPIGYRAGFSKIDGKWKMTALVAGD